MHKLFVLLLVALACPPTTPGRGDVVICNRAKPPIRNVWRGYCGPVENTRFGTLR